MEVNASRVNFAAGVLSRKFLARTDLPNFYNAGAVVCRNFIPQAQGPAGFRSGSKHVIPTKGNKLAVQYPFIFNDEQAYALSFTDQKLRFFSDGGVVLEDEGTSQFSLLSHFNGIDAATAYTAETGQPFSFQGDAQLDTAQKVFGTSSLLLDGVGDYLNIGANDDFVFNKGNFTIEARIRLANVGKYQHIISNWNGSSGSQWLFSVNSANKLVFNWGLGSVTASTPLVANTWYHVAVVKEGVGTNQLKIYLDGVQDGIGQQNTDLSSKLTVTVGNETFSGKRLPFDGWIDELAIRKEVVWATAFVLPTAEYSGTGVKSITAITQANPGVITIGSHGYTGGEQVYLSGITGMTELNSKFYLVVFIGANTFSLTDLDGNTIDTSAYTAYDSLGISQAVYEIDTPYLEADLRKLQFAQKADLMYMVHPSYEPRKLIRSGDASWTLATYTRTSDPFSIVISGVTQANPGVVTATAHGFSDGDLVEIYEIVGMTELNSNTYKVSNKATNTFELTDASTGENIDTTGYGAYGSAGKVFKQGNMPRAVAFFGGRLNFAGTLDAPESFWGSKAPTNAGLIQYDDFTVGASADDAYTFPISSQNNTADIIQWLAGVNKFLGMGAYGGVYKANGGSDATPISGTDISVKAIDASGCKSIMPVRMGSELFYVQRGGLVLNKFGFSLLADNYKSDNMNVFSDEITKTGIIQLTTQQGDADIIWAITTDNRLIGLTVKADEQISAWHDHVLGGTDVKVLSVCGEPQPDNRDSLWLVVERTINSVTRRYVEYWAAEDVLPEKEDYYTGDSDADDLTYRRLMYETSKNLVRVDSALTLDQSQSAVLTPGAATGSGVSFTVDSPVFAATDVGRYIVKKVIAGSETGIAKITAFTSTTEVKVQILEDFDSTDVMNNNEWFLTVAAVSGLDHLEGETVTIQINGADGGTAVVSSGAVTLDIVSGAFATVVHIGLAYTGQIQMMPLDIGALVGTAQARTMTVNKLGVLVRHAMMFKYGTDLYNLEQFFGRSVEDHFNRPPMLVTDVLELPIPDGYGTRKFVHIIQDAPFPCTIQGVIPFVDTVNE